ncbi:hypothetical protein [Niallia taxi]|uniref:hypothetical protein n=1 Tax=Niallia taxi TaxID=2499688 RepID=UPI003D2AF681
MTVVDEMKEQMIQQVRYRMQQDDGGEFLKKASARVGKSEEQIESAINNDTYDTMNDSDYTVYFEILNQKPDLTFE